MVVKSDVRSRRPSWAFKSILPYFLETLFVLALAFKISFINYGLVYQLPNTPWFRITWLFLLNGVPLAVTWTLLRCLTARHSIALAFLFLIDLFCFAALAKLYHFGTPLIFQDLKEIKNVFRVTSTITGLTPGRYYLVFVDMGLWLAFMGLLQKVRSTNSFPVRRNGSKSFQQRLHHPSLALVAILGCIAGIYIGAIGYANGLPSSAAFPMRQKNLVSGSLACFVGSFFDSISIAIRKIPRDSPSQKEVQEAVRWFREHRMDLGIPATAKVRPTTSRGTSPRASIRTRNVIMILIESFGSEGLYGPAMEKAQIDVAPFFNSLKDEFLFTRRLQSPAIGGLTAECEFEILASTTSQLQYGFTFTNLMDRDYGGLVRILKKHGYRTVAFHAHLKEFWNRSNAYERLGFDHYFHEGDFSPGPSIGLGLSDESFFTQLPGMIRSLPEPFFAFIITLSGHPPFVIPTSEQVGLGMRIPNITSNAYNYLEAMRYQDRQIERFWNEMKDIRENTIFVILGDHNARFDREDQTALGYEDPARADAASYLVPLAILAPGIDRDRVGFDPVGDQSDIAPTILDLLGIKIPDYFIGTSLLTKNTTALVQRGGILAIAGSECRFDKIENKCICKEGKAKGATCKELKQELHYADIISRDILLGYRYSYKSNHDNNMPPHNGRKE